MSMRDTLKSGTFGRSMSRLKRGFNSLRLGEKRGVLGQFEDIERERLQEEKKERERLQEEKNERERLQEEKKDMTIDTFYHAFNQLGWHPTIYLTPNDISSLPFIVDIEKFQLLKGSSQEDVDTKNDSGQTKVNKQPDFFTPMPMRTLLSTYPLNLESKEAAERYSIMQRCTDHGGELHGDMGWISLAGKPEYMCSRLDHSVETLPRMGTKNNSRPLRVVTGWRHNYGNEIADDFLPFLKQHTRPIYGFANFWTKKGSFGPYPHIKMCMYHGNDQPVKYLLLGEFLAIIATMCTRMMDPALQKHHIIPVMIFSFVAPNHGRLILFHFDDNTLYIRISELLDLSSKNEESWDTLISYAAADVNPAADTSIMA